MMIKINQTKVKIQIQVTSLKKMKIMSEENKTNDENNKIDSRWSVRVKKDKQ